MIVSSLFCSSACPRRLCFQVICRESFSTALCWEEREKTMAKLYYDFCLCRVAGKHKKEERQLCHDVLLIQRELCLPFFTVSIFAFFLLFPLLMLIKMKHEEEESEKLVLLAFCVCQLQQFFQPLNASRARFLSHFNTARLYFNFNVFISKPHTMDEVFLLLNEGSLHCV